jgi:SulP family sulfate permease
MPQLRSSSVKALKEQAWPDEVAFPVALKDSVFIKHIKGPLFFGSTSEFQQLYKQIPESAKTVVVRLSRMQYMDQTGLYVMEDILQDLKVKGVDVVFIGLLDQPRYMMERIKIIPNLVAENQIYKNFENYLKRLS